MIPPPLFLQEKERNYDTRYKTQPILPLNLLSNNSNTKQRPLINHRTKHTSSLSLILHGPMITLDIIHPTSSVSGTRPKSLYDMNTSYPHKPNLGISLRNSFQAIRWSWRPPPILGVEGRTIAEDWMGVGSEVKLPQVVREAWGNRNRETIDVNNNIIVVAADIALKLEFGWLGRGG